VDLVDLRLLAPDRAKPQNSNLIRAASSVDALLAPGCVAALENRTPLLLEDYVSPL
jgi:hypothetical protein